MASLRDIRKHIHSVKSIRQITYAMKMVAAARIKKAQTAILSSRPFAVEMEHLISDLNDELSGCGGLSPAAGSLFSERGAAAGARGLVLVTADKGLCGSFNSNLLKAAAAWLRENRERKLRVICVGKKSRDFMRRLKGLDLEIDYEMTGIFPKAGYAHANLLARNILELFARPEVGSVTLIYNEFKSVLVQKIVRNELLPLKRNALAGRGTARLRDFGFEPEKAALLNVLLPRYVSAQMYRVLLESQAAELAARMNAMEAAYKNAAELIDGLTLRLNKMRQAMITTELNEIVSGAEALGG
ncbi:MAG TPA: ATP synthase F1 subunit gamma [Elusimicrobiales bacterium]|nr:ATP synthase F1 subunit gamma [Elusimicrobiales bacterium]